MSSFDDYWRQKISEPFTKHTDSPIECLLLGVMSWCWGALEVNSGPCCKKLTGSIHTQHPIGKYRVDIAVIAENIKLAIECDGHEFHEKTKEQAARDKSRKRFLTSQGWTVIEFTGSEIYNDPFQCVDDIVGILITAYKDEDNKSDSTGDSAHGEGP